MTQVRTWHALRLERMDLRCASLSAVTARLVLLPRRSTLCYCMWLCAAGPAVCYAGARCVAGMALCATQARFVWQGLRVELRSCPQLGPSWLCSAGAALGATALHFSRKVRRLERMELRAGACPQLGPCWFCFAGAL